MIKYYKKLKLFFLYRKELKKNKKYLLDKYGLEINILNELYTTIILVDTPPEIIQQYGKAFAAHEIKKYINSLNIDLEKLELNELVNIYEIKKINDTLYGIAFGYSLMSNKNVYISLLLHILGVIGLTIGLLILL